MTDYARRVAFEQSTITKESAAEASGTFISSVQALNEKYPIGGKTV